MTKDKTKTIKGLLKNEIQSMEATLNRLKKILEIMEENESQGVGEIPISEAVDFYIDERCVIDPAIWEDYNALYDDFELFKAQEGITTHILKRAFFAELARRGHYRHPGPGLYFGEPLNSINGIYLRSRRAEVEGAREDRGGNLEEFWKYQAEKQAEEQEIQDMRFEAIVRKTEEEEDPKNGGGLFDFR